MPATRDELIHHLETLVHQLKNALKRIDADVDRAARRYIRSPVPEGYLHFSDFLDLLALEIRQNVKEELSIEKKRLEATRKAVHGAVAERLEELAVSSLPMLKVDLQDFVKLRVLLVRRKEHLSISDPKMVYRYQALSIKGNMKQGLGDTQEEAWSRLREYLAIELSHQDTPKKMLAFLSIEHPLILERFEKAAPWRLDRIGEFMVEIRMEDRD